MQLHILIKAPLEDLAVRPDPLQANINSGNNNSNTSDDTFPTKGDNHSSTQSVLTADIFPSELWLEVSPTDTVDAMYIKFHQTLNATLATVPSPPATSLTPPLKNPQPVFVGYRTLLLMHKQALLVPNASYLRPPALPLLLPTPSHPSVLPSYAHYPPHTNSASLLSAPSTGGGRLAHHGMTTALSGLPGSNGGFTAAGASCVGGAAAGTLEGVGLVTGSVLYAVSAPQFPAIIVFVVNTKTADTLVIRCSPTDSVSDLMQAIHVLTRLDPRRQTLIYQGLKMPVTLTLGKLSEVYPSTDLTRSAVVGGGGSGYTAAAAPVTGYNAGASATSTTANASPISLAMGGVTTNSTTGTTHKTLSASPATKQGWQQTHPPTPRDPNGSSICIYLSDNSPSPSLQNPSPSTSSATSSSPRASATTARANPPNPLPPFTSPNTTLSDNGEDGDTTGVGAPEGGLGGSKGRGGFGGSSSTISLVPATRAGKEGVGVDGNANAREDKVRKMRQESEDLQCLLRQVQMTTQTLAKETEMQREEAAGETGGGRGSDVA
eukprot:GHVQ01016102.1.p1 GENE.GHVQ01016102.1~~GHVQ01016102.1.p1  ORF type:complete len:548 (+),score=112.21 GHVQ01016102.1:270-1913(+)